MPYLSSGGKAPELDDAHLALFGALSNVNSAIRDGGDLDHAWAEFLNALLDHNEFEGILITRHQDTNNAKEHLMAHRYFLRETLAIQADLTDTERIARFFQQLHNHTQSPLEQDLFERMRA